MIEYGVMHGRFQVFHNDHLEYALAAKARCEHLIVGITNPDVSLAVAESSDPHRHTEESNPLNYFERSQLVRCALLDAGIADSALSIVPFPINRPELLRYYVPESSAHFLTIYDDWGRCKKERLEAAGFRVIVLWDRPLHEKRITGSALRRSMAAGSAWERDVPRGVATLLEAWGIPERLRNERGR
jgi:nicotinamide mononucleotide adenylyltransferase